MITIIMKYDIIANDNDINVYWSIWVLSYRLLYQIWSKNRKLLLTISEYFFSLLADS